MGRVSKVNSYDLSRTWFDWCFENPDRINPNHSALYFFCIEHCNRLGWKEKFGLPTTMAKEAIGIKSYNTYKKTLDELVVFGFIKMVEVSKNQYSSNIIALSDFNKALDKAHVKALDKALIKHTSKHSESTDESINSIDKQVNNKQTNKEPITYYDFSFLNLEKNNIKISISEFEKLCTEFTQEITEKAIKYLSAYKIEKGYKTKSDYLTIRRWVIDAVKKQNTQNGNTEIKSGKLNTIGGIEITSFAEFSGVSPDELSRLATNGG